jgi:hypothetical protein
MSRTKGVNSLVRHEHDEYITPDWCVRRLLEEYSIPEGMDCFDPCAANGSLIRFVRAVRPDLTRWLAFEINPKHAEELGKTIGLPPEVVYSDFLALPKPDKPSETILTLSNPPYSLAQRFIEQGLAFTTRVVYLLRLNFLADGRYDRRGFAEKYKPGVFVLPNRPSFDGWGSDGTEYAWFVFGDPTVAGKWFSLKQTPEEEIKRWNAWARTRYSKPLKEAA